MSSETLNVVMPAYNEADGITESVSQVLDTIVGKIPNSRLIVFDDGSSDGTGKILDGLQKQFHPQLQVIHQPNRGHGPTIYRGMEYSRADWILLIDSDGQIELSEFPRFWERRAEADILIGNRVVRSDPPVRLWLSRLIRWYIRTFFQTAINDANVPFKLIRRPLWDEIKTYIPSDTLAPSLFLAVAAKRLKFRMVELEVAHLPRRSGQSSIAGWRLLKFCFKAFGQITAFRKKWAQ